MGTRVVLSGTMIAACALVSCGVTPPSGDTVAEHFAPPDAYPGPAWARDGRDVHPSELNSIAGPEHCEWQDAVMLHIGWPLGTRAAAVEQSRQFVRDPEGIIDPAAAEASLQVPQLPAGARDTRYRLGDLEVWSSPTEAEAIYLASATTSSAGPVSTHRPPAPEARAPRRAGERVTCGARPTR